jgi:hypothetical protein
MNESVGMNGQWLGTFEGGRIIVNIDELELTYDGIAYLWEDDPKFPSSVAVFSTPNKERSFKLRTSAIQAIDPASGLPAAWDTVKEKYGSELNFSTYADIEGSFTDNSLTFSWMTDTGVSASCVLPRSRADQPSELVASEMKWDEFKAYVATLRRRHYIFRGQNEPWRLRTSFHRAGRAELARYLREDIPVLHRHLSAKTRHVFDLQKPDENGAFFNLVQHHGYPTPLLDWSYSPFVAAFFAYRRISNKVSDQAGAKEKVRINVFDQARWKKDYKQVLLLLVPGLHVSIGEFIAIENERLIPQQAVTTLTNVDDIEAYVKLKETESKKYLWAIDLPARDRRQVFRELSYMGITAGSLFPGLDGACEELAERNFQT